MHVIYIPTDSFFLGMDIFLQLLCLEKLSISFFGHEITFNLKIQLLIEKECPPYFATQHCPSKKFPIHYICNVLNQKCVQPLLGNVRL